MPPCFQGCTNLSDVSFYDLIITNSIEENRTTVIKNCVENEVIEMEYPIIKTSFSTHKIQNDFNYNFFRIANTEDKIVNNITFISSNNPKFFMYSKS